MVVIEPRPHALMQGLGGPPVMTVVALPTPTVQLGEDLFARATLYQANRSPVLVHDP